MIQQIFQEKNFWKNAKTTTLKKWIVEGLAASNAFLWLKHENNSPGKVKLMKCKVCTKFEDRIKHKRDFSNVRDM